MTDPHLAVQPPTQPPTTTGRRRFVQWLGAVLGALAGAAFAVPVVGYVFGALFERRPDKWVKLQKADSFADGQTQLVDFDNPYRQPWDGDTARNCAYVRRHGDDFLVFAVNCAHLGCPVSWFPESGLFLCPCHGGVYYADGSRAAGPPPRGLFRYSHEVRADGHLWILAGHIPTLHDPLGGSKKGSGG
jgi:menaquinol-cytochrome c reductase iron-sulfur subunit